ncbi:RNA-binding protein [Candidatus Woesearchaeota archaeon]|nr:MAG: RNA-binding protein [Candidatus Woesearchaeota archaeon]
MSELKTENRAIAVPGEILATGMDFLPSYGTYRFGENIVAKVTGLVTVDGKVIKITPLSGRYLPKRGDTIIAQVTEILASGWRLDMNSAYTAMLSMRDASSEFIDKGADLSRFFNIGDYVITKIVNVTSQKLTDVTMRGPGLRKLRGGRIFDVNTNKVPRIIGKGGSMVSMIKQATGCKILVGQNGLVWLSGEDPKMELLAQKTIKMIERDAHLSGLTDKVKEYLEKETGNTIEVKERTNGSDKEGDE